MCESKGSGEEMGDGELASRWLLVSSSSWISPELHHPLISTSTHPPSPPHLPLHSCSHAALRDLHAELIPSPLSPLLT
eukprot:766356-Hanusia_phi.AAC.1